MYGEDSVVVGDSYRLKVITIHHSQTQELLQRTSLMSPKFVHEIRLKNVLVVGNVDFPS
jgi:hypothetical protein